jgi:hypothetical protein
MSGWLLLPASPLETRAASVDAIQRNPVVRQAIEDLAQRESVPAKDVEVVSVEEVVWPDTSMGCPRPDMRYLQALQDGMRIILQANGRQRAYHSGGNRAPFLCDRKTSQQRPHQIEHVPGPDEFDH